MGTKLRVEIDPVVKMAEYPLVVVRYQADIKGQYGDMLRVIARITDGEFKDAEVTCQFSQKLSPRTNLYTFLKALDIPIPDTIGADLDLDQLLNRQFLGTVKPNQTERGTFNNFEAWRRYVGSTPAASVPTAPSVAPVAAPPAVVAAAPVTTKTTNVPSF